MQIDFHHAVTYVVARISGFNHSEADIIAYSAQYVDDATNDGYISFDNRGMYYRIASAHHMLDYKNFDELANHHAWIPFHFLPGNNGFDADHGHDLSFIEKITCRPNSPIARDMVRESINLRNEKNSLHRFGITMHVYVDTWAHQGFAGIKDKVNLATNLSAENAPISVQAMADKLKGFFGSIFDAATSEFVGGVLPLGHGTVLSYPDQPYLKWKYTNGYGKVIVRNNPNDFLEAADHMCIAMRSFLAGDVSLGQPGLPPTEKATIEKMLRDIKHMDGAERHKTWVAALKGGKFGFDPVDLCYVPKGTNSWKHDALDTKESQDSGDEIFAYTSDFLTSNWKHFHDALQMHRIFVLQKLLPKYGICAA